MMESWEKSPQEIYDNWKKLHESLLKKYGKLMDEGEVERGTDISENIKIRYNIFKNDLILAALIKFLNIQIKSGE